MRLTVIASLLAALALPACADGLKLTKTGKSRAEQMQRQQRLMDSRLAGQYQQSARLKSKADETPKPRKSECYTASIDGYAYSGGMSNSAHITSTFCY